MARSIKIFLDGQAVADEEVTLGADTATLSYDMSNDEGRLSVGFSNEFGLIGDAYAYVISRLVDAPNASTNSIALTVEATCCTASDGSPLVVYRGIVSRGEISFCEAGKDTCVVRITSLDGSRAAEKVQCLKNAIIHERRNGSQGEDEERLAPFFGYYEEPRPYSFAYIGIFLVLYLLALTAPFRAVIAFINLLGGNINSFNDSTATLLSLVLKKRFHKAPFISSYLANACKICGLQLNAPLFQVGGAYRNLTRLDAPYVEGAKDISEARRIYRELNSPNITFEQFFASFKELNLGYIVTDDTLIFDRIDRIYGQLWIDLSTGDRLIYDQCYEAADIVQPALETFTFASDAADKIGDESNRLWSGGVVDYNTPINPILTGVRQTQVQYGSARFIDDGIPSATADVLSNPIYAIATLGQSPVARNAMLMSTGTCAAPKLLIWDSFSPVFDATVRRRRTSTGNYAYNVAAWLNQNTQGSFGIQGFYDNLLVISDPRRNLKKNFAFTLRFRYLCEDLRTIGYGKYIKLRRGTQVVRGDIKTVEIDLIKGEMTITGVI